MMKQLYVFAVACMGLTLVSCDHPPASKLEEAIDAPPPKHPAMASSTVGSSSGPGGGSSKINPHGGLPAGHPPIESSQPSSETPTEGAAPATSPPKPTSPSQGDGPLKVGKFTFDVAEGLVREAPKSQMRLAQFRLPRAEGDLEDGEMSVIQASGSVADNIARWRKQFLENPQDDRQAYEPGGTKVTTVRIAGTFTASRGPFAGGGTPKTGFRLWGAIVDMGGGGSLFFKAVGPQSTIAAHEDGLEAMVTGLKTE
jgi:hypothetical protein